MSWNFKRLNAIGASAGTSSPLRIASAMSSGCERSRAQFSSGEGLMGSSAFAVASYLISSVALASAANEIPAPRDIAYRGTIHLFVDATDTDHAVFRVSETIPVPGPGPLVLLYPEWVPGTHSTTGPIDKVAGLSVRARGLSLEWRRDPINMYAFHLVVPAGADSINVEFQYASATSGDQGPIVVTHDIIDLEWNALLLYPAGYFVRRIPVEPSVKLPDRWLFGGALETTSADDSSDAQGVVHFRVVDLETLVDSPLLAGRFFQRFLLDDSRSTPVRLDVVADRSEALQAAPEQIRAHQALVKQAYKIFGPPAYRHYDFLLALTNELGELGTEHLESSQNSGPLEYFSGWDTSFAHRSLRPHEFVHSWNGKYRRPADLWTASFNVPMQDSLLWVYEGQTNYWGQVLASRSGLISMQENLDRIAIVAAIMDIRVGRVWRSLADTVDDPIINYDKPIPWLTWQRNKDYYEEGSLIWLEIDTLIRELSQDTRSLEDFAHIFFHVKQRNTPTLTYTRDDVVAALSSVQRYDWSAFLRQRLTSLAAAAPLDGLARGGYRLVYTPVPSEYFVGVEKRYRSIDLSWSIGLSVSSEMEHAGSITDVLWDGPAFRAGLTVGTKIIAVNGFAYDSEDLRNAIAANRNGGRPIELLVQNGSRFHTVQIDYRGGLRYPHLERVPGTVDRLTEILAPRT